MMFIVFYYVGIMIDNVVNVLIYFIFIFLDIEECFVDFSLCYENVDCFNFKGFYSCLCRIGFIGDGKIC